MSAANKRFWTVLILLAAGYALERAGHYAVRSTLVPALLSQGDSVDTYRTYGLFMAALNSSVIIGALIAIGTGPRGPVVIGTFVGAVGAVLVMVESMTGAMVTLGIAQALFRASILAWFALLVRSMPFTKRLALFAGVYAIVSVGAFLSAPIRSLGDVIGPMAPAGLGAFLALLAGGAFITAWVVHGKISLADEIRGGMPEVGLIPVLIAGVGGSFVTATAINGLNQVIYETRDWVSVLSMINPVVVVLAGGAIAAGFAQMGERRGVAGVALAVALTGTGLLALFGHGLGLTENIVAAVGGMAITSAAEPLLAGVVLALISYVHPRFIPVGAAVWASAQTGAWMGASSDLIRDAKLPAAVAVVVLLLIASALFAVFRRGMDGLFGITSKT